MYKSKEKKEKKIIIRRRYIRMLNINAMLDIHLFVRSTVYH